MADTEPEDFGKALGPVLTYILSGIAMVFSIIGAIIFYTLTSFFWIIGLLLATIHDRLFVKGKNGN